MIMNPVVAPGGVSSVGVTLKFSSIIQPSELVAVTITVIAKEPAGASPENVNVDELKVIQLGRAVSPGPVAV